MKNQDIKYVSPFVDLLWGHFLDRPTDPILKFGDNVYSLENLITKGLQYYQFIKDNCGDKKRIIFDNRDDFESYARLVGISLTGASFVPLQNSYPTKRKQEILASLDDSFVLGDEHQSDFKAEIPNSFTELQFQWTDEVYVLFTSGSTGKPKGVPLLKKNIRAFRKYYLEESSFELNSHDRFLQTFELSFDFAMHSVVLGFALGAQISVCDFGQFRYLQIPDLLEKDRITVVIMVGFVLGYLDKYLHEMTFPDLRYSIFGGGPLYIEPAKKWQKCLPNGEVRNGYGPAETTILCTDYPEQELKSKNGIVAMGYLFPNMDYQIVDDELLLAGDQVFVGYLDESQNKFSIIDGKQFYHTGDLVSMDADGLLYFEGRKDFQVKIDGYRVELEEIEGKVHEALGVLSVAFVHDQELILLVEAKVDEIRTWCRKNLPSYMNPKQVVLKNPLVRNSNQKIDRGGNLRVWKLGNLGMG